MRMSSAIAEIVSEFSGFQHIHTSQSSSSMTSTLPVSRKTSTSSESPRHSLNITVGVSPLNQIVRNDSSNSLNDFNCLKRKNSSASYLVIE
ncbi:hypothetical protein GCK72_019918 [Caenorhabditis remanei]|uniref:Uncharacterized protein n=1 Tax=Caenorhabditis remanei TaxID=31234 RepID=E3LJI3_CAERE|nr:hypothetical protein GCK72_019922 [Caenorhabditis remanei]XP_003116696.2 hypothetical protein GCK72_019918 [Caenorhabditis remanei]EFO95063.1 hypothetical protein CRE_08719 [Caenorhabditis remanei]KAF1753362.1 hypothetical protein GCK72_019918 [Caenorhabditis remanei]KAF1753366.1 hypothetical protein GCK72_019922 [Caenorhabditis remanei]